MSFPPELMLRVAIVLSNVASVRFSVVVVALFEMFSVPLDPGNDARLRKLPALKCAYEERLIVPEPR